MPGRLVALSIADVEYHGDSIGDDLTLVVELGGGRLEINKKLLPGQRSQVDREISQFWSESTELPLSGVVRIIERDPVYTESGQALVQWGLDARQDGQHESTINVEVSEVGGRTAGGVATFVVRVRANIVSSTRYVPETEDGWLTVLLEDSRQRVSLPEGVHVEVTRTTTDREYFRVGEGAYRGRAASVRLNADGSSRLVTDDRRTAAARLVYSLSKKELRVGTKRYACTDDPSSRLAKNTYDVEIPDAPHKGGLSYPEAKRARTWFRIGHQGDRYIHTGRASAGCVTVVERSRWDDLASSLVRFRKGDGVSVGTLEVVE